MSEENERISKLLRLKRYEQPPPEYFQNFLKEFHVRQRQELLQRPAWKIALERLQARFDGFIDRLTAPQLSYAGASVAVLLAAGIFTVNLLQHPGQSGLGGSSELAVAASHRAPQAFQPAQAPAAAFQTASVPVHPAQAVAQSPFTLDPREQMAEVIPAQAFQPAATRTHPRYILDSRPVSYEPPFSF